MPTEIDKLVINIETESESTYKSINKLANNIGKLSNAVGKLDTSKLSGAANSIQRFGKALQTMNGIKTTDFTKVAKGFDKFAKLDVSGLSKASSGLNTLSRSLNALGNVQNLGNVTPTINAIKNLGRIDMSGFDTSKIALLADSLSNLASKLSGVSSIDGSVTRIVAAMARLANSGQYISNVATYFPQLGNQVVALVGQLSTADAIDASIVKIVDGIARLASAGKKIQVTVANLSALGNGVVALVNQLNGLPQVNTNLANLVQGLGNIAASGSKAGNVVNGLSNKLNLFSKSSKTAKNNSFSLASAIGKVYATYWMLFRVMGKVRDAIDISAQITEVQNVVNTTFGKYRSLIEEFSSTSIVDYGMSELTSKKVASTFQAMGGAMGFAQGQMANMSVELTKLTADMASFYDIDQQDVAEDLQSIFTGQTRPLRQYGLDLTQATLKEWALKNGMDADISSMSQMEKTMLRYKYVLANTKNAQGDFQKTQNTWANQVRILKENLSALGAVMGSVFINALKPMVSALNKAMSALTSFAKTVSASIGKIFGWQYEDGTGGLVQDYEDASDSADDLADSTGTIADNIEKAKDGLRAFDKLNVINMSKDSSSNSSDDSNSGDSSASTGTWTQVDSMFKDYESTLDNLGKLGSYISAKLTESMNSIDWDSIYAKARNFGTGLATFLNGLITPDLFGAVGSTIAGALNTAINASLSFADTFDFENLGESISTGVKNFFEDFHADEFAESINLWVQGLYTAFKTAVTDEEMWKKALSKVGEFISNLDVETVEIIIGTLLIKNILKVTLGNFSLSALIGNAMKNFIGGALSMSLSELVVTIKTITFTSGFLGSPAFLELATQIWGEVSKALNKILPDGVYDFLSNLGAGLVVGAALGSWFPGAGQVAGAILGAIVGAMNGIEIDGETIMTHIINGIFNFDMTKDLLGNMEDCFDKVKKAFEEGDWASIGTNIILGIINGIGAALTFLVEPIADLFTTIWDGICELFGIHSPAKEMESLGENILLGIVEGFKNAFSSMTEAVTEFFTEFVPEKIGEFKDNAVEFSATVKGKIDETFTTMKEKWDSIKDKLSTLKGKAENVASGVFDSLKGFWGTIKDKTSTLTGKAENKASGVLSTLKSGWETIKTKAATLTAKASASSKVTDKLKTLKGYWNTIKDKTATMAVKIKDSLTEPLKKMWNALAKSINSAIKVINKIPGVNIKGSVPTFATGGFPEEGPFYMNRGEIAGKFSNGKTAVVNNRQITDGISAAVYDGNRENNGLLKQEIALLQAQNQLLTRILEKDTGISAREVFDSVRNSAKEYTNRTGNPAFI